jgi:hypothetical protein
MSGINLFLTPIVYDNINKSWQESVVEYADDLFYFGGPRIHVEGNKAKLVEDESPVSIAARCVKIIGATVFTLGIVPIAALVCKFVLNPRDSLTGLYTDSAQNKITANQQKKIRKVITAGSANTGPATTGKHAVSKTSSHSKPVVTIDITHEEPLPVVLKTEKKEPIRLDLTASEVTLSSTVKKNEEIVSACGISYVLKEDLQRFADNVWLNDACLNTSFENLVVQSDDCLIASSYYAAISSPYKMFHGSDTRTPTALFQDKKPIFVPLNVSGVHWALAKVDLQTQKIHYYDSLSWDPGVEVEKLKELILGYAAKERAVLNEDAFKVIKETCPQQTNGSDCGVFTYMAASRLMRGESLTYSAKDVSAMRLQMRQGILSQVAVGV